MIARDRAPAPTPISVHVQTWGISMSTFDEYDEYKFVVKATERLSNRRLSVTQFFFSIDTALLAAIAYVSTNVDTRIWGQVAVTLGLSAFGLLLSVIWYRVVSDYRRLIVWRYDQIMAMEELLDGSYKLFKKEWESFFSSKSRPELARYIFGISGFEIVFPWFFFGLHALIALIIVIMITT
jgi:hypothetical protein